MSQVLGKSGLAYARSWQFIDVSRDPRPLGRIATSIAITLMGKHKPIYDPSNDCGDYVVAVGCQEIHLTGKKKEQKEYFKQSTRPGKSKAISIETIMSKQGGAEVLRKAVSGMLPKNRLRDVRLARLRAFNTDEHPYGLNLIKFHDSVESHPQSSYES